MIRVYQALRYLRYATNHVVHTALYVRVVLESPLFSQENKGRSGRSLSVDDLFVRHTYALGISNAED